MLGLRKHILATQVSTPCHDALIDQFHRIRLLSLCDASRTLLDQLFKFVLVDIALQPVREISGAKLLQPVYSSKPTSPHHIVHIYDLVLDASNLAARILRHDD